MCHFYHVMPKMYTCMVNWKINNYNLLTSFILFVECKVEVILSLERQNDLISSCHDGLGSGIESIASSGHLGK